MAETAEHVPDPPVENPHRKLEKTVLDNFAKIINNQPTIRVKSAVNLLRHVVENSNTEKGIVEVNYALGRLVRGLGSSTTSARTGFYTTLVALIGNLEVEIGEIFQAIEKHLHKAGNNSKGENADVCTGKILACGAIIRSGLYAKSSKDQQKKVVETLLTSAKERVYLGLVAYKFIENLLETVEEKHFSKTVWPLVKPELTTPWLEYNLDKLFLLLSVQEKYPGLVGEKFLKLLEITGIFHGDNAENLCDILMTIPRVTAIKHPVYELVGGKLAQNQNLRVFLDELDKHLHKPNRNKHLVLTQLYTIILTKIQEDYTQIPHILTANFIRQTLNYFKSFKGRQKDGEFQQLMHNFFETLLNTLKIDAVTADTKIDVLKKLLFPPGTFIFEKITRSKLVQQMTASLNVEGVRKLAVVYKDVVAGKYRESDLESLYNNDRLYAAHLLVKLLKHAAMHNEDDWRVEQLEFLMGMALKKVDNVGCELAASLKDTFFNALDMKLPKLSNLQLVLSKLTHNWHAELTNNPDNLRTSLTEEDQATWEKTLKFIRKLEGGKKKKTPRKIVFLTLFLHMGLQLFNDVKLATDSLNELFVCYEKIHDKKKMGDDSEDLEWIEVVVDIFLNLLSHNSHLLRSVVRCVFPHLCEDLTASSVHQILAVLDPENEAALGRANEDSSEDEDEEEEDSNEEEEEDDEDDDDETETVNDKLRLALQEVLLLDAAKNSEDMDLDLLSDTEGEKLNDALADAFKQFKPNHGRSNKQSKDQETLTHFRIRVLDLVEIYLDSNPDMHLALEVMLPLLQAVEFAVRDKHQRPLLARLQACLRKLAALKKFGGSQTVTSEILVGLLRSLLEKGTKNSILVQNMAQQISDCCLFIVRCANLLQVDLDKAAKSEMSRALGEVFLGELQGFFHKRDSLTPFVLFKSLLQMKWRGNEDLASMLWSFVFNEEIKPFRRNQALELLKVFYSNHRFLSEDSKKLGRCLKGEHAVLSVDLEKFFGELIQNPRVAKERFISNLFLVLSAVKVCPLDTTMINWVRLGELVRDYRSHVTLSNDAKTAFNKLCRCLGVSNIVKMQKVTEKLTNNEEEEDEVAKPEKKRGKKHKNPESVREKKEAKALRLASLSEGLTSVEFNIGNSDEELDGEKHKKRKSDAEGSGKKRKIQPEVNGLTNGDSTHKKKKKKTKA